MGGREEGKGREEGEKRRRPFPPSTCASAWGRKKKTWQRGKQKRGGKRERRLPHLSPRPLRKEGEGRFYAAGGEKKRETGPRYPADGRKKRSRIAGWGGKKKEREREQRVLTLALQRGASFMSLSRGKRERREAFAGEGGLLRCAGGLYKKKQRKKRGGYPSSQSTLPYLSKGRRTLFS